MTVDHPKTLCRSGIAVYLRCMDLPRPLRPVSFIAAFLAAFVVMVSPAAATVPECYHEGEEELLVCPEQPQPEQPQPEQPQPEQPQPEVQPQPQPAPAEPAPTPDEGDAPAPAIEIEHASLTLLAKQVDPPATIGGEQTILPAATVDGSGTSAVAVPTGALPYSGLSTAQVALLGVLLTLVGCASWTLGARRRSSLADAAGA
jgi:outer membrane biosynthesis protein TonB